MARVLTAVFADGFQLEPGAEEAGAEEEHVELFTTPQTKMGAATSDFGYNLFRALASRDATANVFLAPISVSAVLTQLSMGDSANALHTKYTHAPSTTLAEVSVRNTSWLQWTK